MDGAIPAAARCCAGERASGLSAPVADGGTPKNGLSRKSTYGLANFASNLKPASVRQRLPPLAHTIGPSLARKTDSLSRYVLCVGDRVLLDFGVNCPVCRGH